MINMVMQELNLPKYSFKIKTSGSKAEIFDSIRKKYITLSPEEWVRQNFIKYLVSEKNMPQSLIAVEKQLKYNNLEKRADAVIYDKSGCPRIIIECKSPDIKISQEAFEQIARYNMSLKVDYLIVTNGLTHYCCRMDYENNSYSFMEDIPAHSDIL